MTTITLRSLADFPAAVAGVLGFVPSEDFVVLPVRGGRRPHSRIDHPHTGEQLLEVAATIGAAYRQHPGPVVLVAITEDQTHALDAFTAVTAILDGLCEVVHAIWINDDQVHDVATGQTVTATPIESAAFTAGMVAAGRALPVASREQRRQDLIEGDPSEVVALIGSALEHLHSLSGNVAGAKAEGEWIEETLRIYTATGCTPSAEEVARIVLAMGVNVYRDAAIALINRDNAHQHMAFWGDAVRRSPAEVRAYAALLLAFSAYLAGDGAAAWIALDAAEAPSQPLHQVVATALENAIDPDVLLAGLAAH